MDFQLTEEQREFKHVVHEFVAKEVKPLARHTDETGEFNWTAVKKMGPFGLLGLEVPEVYGGAEVDAISSAIAIEELGWGCGSTALAVSAHNGLGAGANRAVWHRRAKADLAAAVGDGARQAGLFVADRTGGWL